VEVVETAHEAGEIADSIAVGVHESGYRQAIDYGVLVPEVVDHSRARKIGEPRDTNRRIRRRFRAPVPAGPRSNEGGSAALIAVGKFRRAERLAEVEPLPLRAGELLQARELLA
jgi:hypothetical protein